MAESINKYTVVESLNQMLYESATTVTAVHSGSDQTLDDSHTALYVGTGGNVVLTLQSGSDATFTNLASGQILPVKFSAIKATNTTATNMLALK